MKVNQRFFENLKAQGLTPKLRLWNLQDAKECDILYARGSYFKEYLFMFSSFTEDNVISTHFGYDVFHGTFDKKLTRFGRKEDFMSVTPATKEQRDALMKAMADAGWEFDFEKKELKLKKIEQKPAENKGMNLVEEEMTPFQKKVFSIIDTAIEEEQGLKQVCDELLALASNEIKQKPAEWSEEDKEYLAACIDVIDNFYILTNEYISPLSVSKSDGHKINGFRREFAQMLKSWLKSLKDRIQPKQEWSEEDKGILLSVKCVIDNVWHSTLDIDTGYSREELKEMWMWLDEIWQRVEYPAHEEEWDKKDEDTLNNILYILNQLKDNIVNPEDRTAERCISWLKSLRYQKAWKPTEEQMRYLLKYAEQNNYDGTILTSLYNDLKQL